MSKSPGRLEEYDGDGDWFKIAYLGPLNDTDWSTYGKKEVGRPGPQLSSWTNPNLGKVYNPEIHTAWSVSA